MKDLYWGSDKEAILNPLPGTFLCEVKMKLTDLKGVGPKTEELFQKIGIFTPEDLIHDYPIHYDQFEEPLPIGSLRAGVKQAVRGTISGRVTMRRFGSRSILTTELSDPTGKIQVNWYQALFLKNLLRPGSVHVFRGIVTERKGRRILEHPEIYSPQQYKEKEKTLVPIYGMTKGLTTRMIGKAVGEALKIVPLTNEYLPESLLHLAGLADEGWAIRKIHFPTDAGELEKARKRIVFDEFFLFILTMRLLKDQTSVKKNAFPMKKTWDTEEVIAGFPYKLTGAQRRVWNEIERDLAGDRLMSRLIQGDVGSGKTIIAFLGMVMAASNGYQSALMAPTEVLARQHFDKLTKLKGDQGLDFLHPVLLTGSLKASERRTAYEQIASGAANAVVGTQALIQEGVRYQKLALVITDEQHRFGVHQRKALMEKGDPPNSMVMSATPIPRTLAVIFYGDLDISVIDELPARRLPIKNAVVDESYRPAAMKFIRRQVEAGRQVYVICPMIEANEEFEAANVLDECSAFRKAFPDFEIGLMHGRLKEAEKEQVMEDFVTGKTQILVSTTVVEVGVDVPNATVMLIENAERFGLAALHQLRGRVGRGQYQSYCIFMAGESSDSIEERLGILQKSNDGFEIAEKDLELRGPGDLLGIRQSGDTVFHLADVARDQDVLALAGQMAAALMADDPALIHEEDRLLKEALARYRAANEKNLVL